MSDASNPAADLAEAIHDERRLEGRHLVHWPILIGWTTAAGPQMAQGRTLELSFGGVRVAVEHNFAIGEKVACRLSVQPWHGNNAVFDIDATGRIVHSAYSAQHDGFDVGVQFTGFAGDGKDRLSKVVQAL